MTDNTNPGNFANRTAEDVKNVASKGGQTGTENSGFASMDSDKQKDIASMGGKASSGSFEPGSEKAKEAGRECDFCLTAVVLAAVEDTLKSQSCEFSPTAYFAALLALLTQCISGQDGLVNKELATCVVYLLDIVGSHVPAPLLRSKFSQILTSLSPILSSPDVEAPLVRSSVGCLETLLLAQDGAAWALSQTQISPRRAIAGLLVLAHDHRPKVRKRAQEAIAHVLQSPPPSPSLDHPAADMCAEAALKTATDVLAATTLQGKKGRKEYKRLPEDRHPGLIHALQLIHSLASVSRGWPSKKIEPLCELLIHFSGSNEWLTLQAFEIFEAIFRGMAEEVASTKLPKMLQVIEEMKPALDNEKLAPSWCAIISRGYVVSAQVEKVETFQKLPQIFESVKQYCSSGSYNIRKSASECLISFLSNCISEDAIIEPSIYDEKVLGNIAKSTIDLLSIKYQTAWMEVFSVLSATFDAYRYRSVNLLNEIVKILGGLRESDSFSGKKEIDQVLGQAISNMGPANVLAILPLGLAKPIPGQAGRAWLLPILRDHVQNTDLMHFRSELVPLSEVLYQRIIDHGAADKTMELKIYETLVQQIWDILPGYCTLPIDVPKAFDQTFAEMLANLLYKQTSLRINICNGLQTLVESLQAFVASDLLKENQLLQHRLTKPDAEEALKHLAGLAGNLLAVLFNVYSETLPQYRGYILQCINAILSIIPEKELLETFHRVAVMLEDALRESSDQTQAQKQQEKQERKQTDTMPPASHTLMDLVITLSIYLPRHSFPALFNLAAHALPLKSDAQLQKKAYKLLPRLSKSIVGATALKDRNSELQLLLLDTQSSVTPSARRDRLAAITVVVEHLPDTELHFVPSVLSEVVIACKEVNDKARTTAFDLLILMAQKVSAGGKIEQSKIPHMDDSAPVAEASLEEFFTMVSAGLVGNSPHMISATITALARILHEFILRLPRNVMEDIVQTMSLFLTSTNREIVRAVLGFVKVAIISLPEDLIRPRLEGLIPGLMQWSHEHKARFRSKVKHILERAVRRFGYDSIESYCPEADKKLIQNIRKTRERRKKKNQYNKDDPEDDSVAEEPSNGSKGRFESEHDEVLYGSASSSDASDDETEARQRSSSKRKASGTKTYISEAQDEPLDLLDRRSLANISSRKPVPTKQPPTSTKRKGKIKVDGKLVINDNDSDDDDKGGGVTRSNRNGNDDAMALDARDEDEGGGINAYVEAVKGKDAIQRGQRGRLKYSNKRDRGDAMDIDGEEDGAAAAKKVRFADGGNRKGAVGSKAKKKGFATGANGQKMNVKAKGGISKRVERRGLGGGKIGKFK
ncbi:uncharacterized protein KY384_004339 [Bacidia gigantensis]|uniref:uncharacterized protein n=1 Tax=Bacidia gigantensis TaxID=2732470 RepID=UPI001D04E182|nr:uncharacterized protein KY384_004339 [Bacidia gigantensis]KAG8530982.1 hypothetical protein KY384_004339 [Bacidia gigantensis]